MSLPPDATQARLIASLADAKLFGASCTHVTLLETHISYVLLTGREAFKIKKAVALPFLDFRTLEARREDCDREIALNRRFAPDVYLGVVPITGTPDTPRIGGDGPPIEWAVRMREFPQEDVLSAVIARGGLTETHVDELARAVAGFHQGTASVSVDRGGAAPPVSADTPIELARANFTEIAPLLASDGDRRAVRSLERWTDGEIDRLAPVFRRRWSAGFVRDGHGDLHAGNAAIVDGRITLFDCVEFNDTMRWGDVMADVAFMVMDLHARGRPDFAHRFLNAYLEQTGDYEGLDVLRFYVVFRAMVRAKVAAIRAYADAASRDASIADCRDHLALAERCAATRRGAVVIAHGFSGCGKSTVAQRLVDWCGAIRIRTDVERKRLHGLPPAARTGSPLNAGLYTVDETSRTYEAIGRIAGCVARAGYSAIADGAFLKRWQRDRLRAAAQEAGVSFLIFDVVASEATLRRRIEARGRDPSEADLDVLASQMATSEPLEDDELARTVRYDTELIECELMPPAGNPAVSTGPRERSETHSGISPGTKFAH